MPTPRHCQRCKAEIPTERLEMLPETRLCVPCSQAVGSDFKVSISPDVTSKQGSLKKNYGSINVHKERRRIKPLDS